MACIMAYFVKWMLVYNYKYKEIVCLMDAYFGMSAASEVEYL